MRIWYNFISKNDTKIVVATAERLSLEYRQYGAAWLYNHIIWIRIASIWIFST